MVGPGAALAGRGFPVVGVSSGDDSCNPSGLWRGAADGTAPLFSRHFVFECFRAHRDAGDKQPRSSGGSHDLLERRRILGACRAGRDWFSPSGAASRA
jgi:hypothetical protein